VTSGCDEERRPVAEFMREFIVKKLKSFKNFTFAISFADELLYFPSPLPR